MRVALRQQIKAVEREIQLRRNVYPRLVATRKMRQSEADLNVAHMGAVLDTLVWLSRNEDAVRAFVAASRREDRA